jgi:hypothetical protein
MIILPWLQPYSVNTYKTVYSVATYNTLIALRTIFCALQQQMREM